MSVPFNVGDPAAKFELVADAVRVFSTKVIEVGRGYVVDEQGQRHEFDAAGESPDLVPMDNELAVELMVRGEGFTVMEEDRLLDPWEHRPEPENDPWEPPDLGGNIGF